METDKQFHKENFEKVWSIANENREKNSLVGSINTHKKKKCLLSENCAGFFKKTRKYWKSGWKSEKKWKKWIFL